MRSGSQIYVRKSRKDQWTAGTVLKLGPKTLYRVENSEEPLSQLCPKSEIKPLTIQLSEAYKEGTPVMYYDHEKERWMHGALLGQVVAIAKVRLYTRRARGEVELWFEEVNTSESYPVDQAGLSSSEDVRTLVQADNKGNIKFNELYQEKETEEEEDPSVFDSGRMHDAPQMMRSLTSAGISSQHPKGRRSMQPSASWSHYNQQDGTTPSLTHPFFSSPFTLPPESSGPNAYQLNSNQPQRTHLQKDRRGRAGSRGIPAHPKSAFFRNPMSSTTLRKQPTGHTLYHQPHPSGNNPNVSKYGQYPASWQTMMQQMFDSGNAIPMMNPLMMNSMMMNSMMMNSMMMNPMMMNSMMMMNPMMASMMMQPSMQVYPSAPTHTFRKAKGWGNPPPPRAPPPKPPQLSKQPRSETLRNPQYEEINMGMTHVPSTAGLTSQTRGSSHTHTAEHVSVPESSEGSEVSPRETKHTNRPSSGRSGRRLHARPGSAEKRLKHICLEEDIQENTDTLGSPPVVESCSSEDVTIQAGKPIQMSCTASGNPPPTITWRHNGQLISSEDSHYYIPAPGFLYISSAVESDCGFYTCSIINDFGNVSRCFYLNVTPDQAAAHKLSIPVDPSEDLLTSVGSVSSFTEKVTKEELNQLSPEARSLSPKEKAEVDRPSKLLTKKTVILSKSSPHVGKVSDEDTSGVGTMTQSSGESDPNTSSLERTRAVLHRRDSLTTYLYGTDYGSGSIPNLVDGEENGSEDLQSKSAPKVTFPLTYQTILTPVKETNEQDASPRTSLHVTPPAIVVTNEGGEEKVVLEDVVANGVASDPEIEESKDVSKDPSPQKNKKASTPVLSKLFKKLSPKRAQQKTAPVEETPPAVEATFL